MTLGNLENLPAAGRLRFFLENWKKLTLDTFILKVVQGCQIPLLSEPTPLSSPSEVQTKQEEQILADQKIEKMLEKQATFKRPVSEYPFPSHQKRRRISSSGQFEKLELVHPIQTLQNGRSISFERNSPEERLYVQDRFKGRLFCSSPSFKLPETYQVEMERECLSVSMPLLWLKFSSKGIHETNEDPNFRHAEIECKTDNISR